MKSPTERFLASLRHAPRVRSAVTLAPATALRLGGNVSARIAGRFARCATQRALDGVLAISRVGSWTQYVAGNTALTIAPRVALALAAPAQPANTHTIERELHDVERIERAVRVDRLVERLATRVERIDTLRGERVIRGNASAPAAASLVPPAAASRSPAAPPPQRVERVLRAAASAPVPKDGDSRVTASDLRERELPLRAGLAPAPAPATRTQPFDVEQLADRVVRVIDRRLTASRERLGRI